MPCSARVDPVRRRSIFRPKAKMPLTSLLFPLLALTVVLWIANGMLARTDANLGSDGRPHQLITPTDHLLSAKRNHTLLVPPKMSLCPPVPTVMGKMFHKGRHLTPCHPRPVLAVGRVPVNNSSIRQDLTPAEIGADHWDSLLDPGGRNRPKSCAPRHKVAIIIPLRDREQHLRQFLRHMHPFLNKQQLDYTIFVVEQTGIWRTNTYFKNCPVAPQTTCFFLRQFAWNSATWMQRIFYFNSIPFEQMYTLQGKRDWEGSMGTNIVDAARDLHMQIRPR